MRLASPLLSRTPTPTAGSNTATMTTTTTTTTAMVILNTPITNPPSILFERLWDSSSFHICADGGANRLYTATKEMDKYLPDTIRGDLDSLQDHVRDYYESKHVQIEKDSCQDTNDLDKALQRIASPSTSTLTSTSTLPSTSNYNQVIIYGAFGGRFDQEMASFQALYKWADTFDNRIWLYSDETSAILIPAGKMVEIEVPFQENDTGSTIQEGPTCGLIPMGSKVDSITTSGLKWDLQDAETEFGGLLSTSNHIIGDHGCITVTTSHPIIFTAEIVCRDTRLLACSS